MSSMMDKQGSDVEWGHTLCLPFVQGVWEYAIPRKDDGALHQVLQLPDVARPGIPLEGSHGFRRNRVDLLSQAVAELLHEMCHKSGNICPALS
jgi:hypothetical protein